MRGTGIGTSLLLIFSGAVLAFAVDYRVSGINISAIGAILLIVGIIGLLLSVVFAGDVFGGATGGGTSRRASGGDTVIIDPRFPTGVESLGCCSPEHSYFAAGFGSIWTYDTPTGTVERWDGQSHQGAFNVHVTDPPFYGGLCLTSIATGAGAVWVTVAGNVVFGC